MESNSTKNEVPVEVLANDPLNLDGYKSDRPKDKSVKLEEEILEEEFTEEEVSDDEEEDIDEEEDAEEEVDEDGDEVIEEDVDESEEEDPEEDEEEDLQVELTEAWEEDPQEEDDTVEKQLNGELNEDEQGLEHKPNSSDEEKRSVKETTCELTQELEVEILEEEFTEEEEVSDDEEEDIDEEEDAEEEVDEDGVEVIEEDVDEYEEEDLEEEVEEDLQVKLTEAWEENPQKEEDTVEKQLDEELNEDEQDLEHKPNSSNEKKRSVEETTSEFTQEQTYLRKKSKQEELSNSTSEIIGFGSTDRGICSGASKAVTDKDATAEKGGTTSSSKRRRSRWDVSDVQGDNTVDDGDDRISKRRKTRWDIDDSQLKLLGPIQLPDFTKEFLDESNADPDFQWLKERLIELNCLLRCSDIHDKNFVEILSIKLRNKLIRERQTVIAKLIKKNPAFKSPPDYEPPKASKKLYVPLKEYPDFNFRGLIIGPQGNTLKKMEKESGARIFLRGKGSTLKITDDPSENEDLHVLIEAGSQYSVEIAVKMVEKLLNPFNEECIDHKNEQLKELAKLNGTFKDEGCKLCHESGHMHYACPNSKSTFSRFTDFALGLTPSPNKKINDAKLYVAHLPQAVDAARLSELFYPFGKLKDVKVIKDHTTGLSKGYGFVEFENPSDAAVATGHTNGLKMDGHVLAVNVAERPRPPIISLVSHPPLHPGPIRLPLVVHSPSFRSPVVTTPLTPGQIPSFLSHSQPSMNSYRSDKVPVLSPIPLPQLPNNLDYSCSEFKSYVVTPPAIRPSPDNLDYSGLEFKSSAPVMRPSPNNLDYSSSEFKSTPPIIRPLPNNLDYSSVFKSYLTTPVNKPPPSLLSQFPGNPDYPGSRFL